jgi:hypothetical protein
MISLRTRCGRLPAGVEAAFCWISRRYALCVSKCCCVVVPSAAAGSGHAAVAVMVTLALEKARRTRAKVPKKAIDVVQACSRPRYVCKDARIPNV